MKVEIRQYNPPSPDYCMVWVDDRETACLECVLHNMANRLSGNKLLWSLDRSG